jgi:hypothetical protein
MNIKHRTSLILVSIAIPWIFDQLFFEKTPGISFPILVIVFLAGLIWTAWREKVKPAIPTIILMAIVLFFSAMTFIREQPFLTFINYLLSIAGLGLLLVTYENGLWAQYSLSDYFMGALRLIGAAFANPVRFLSSKASTTKEGNDNPARKTSFWTVLIGILIAIPIVGALIGLLASADPIFSGKVDDFFKIFRIEKWGEYLFRGCYILILAYLVIGMILHAITATREKKLIGVEKPWLSPFLEWIQAIIVLGAVNLVFLAFVVIQFQYFFGGQSNIVIDGYTFAEYARNGFNELVSVTVISLLLLFALTSVTKRVKPNQRKSFSALGVVLVLLVVVILVSAFQRLLLYESAYGFTRIRVQTHVLMIWLGILLVAALVLELINKPRFFGLAVLLVAFGFGLTLNVINPDALIVRLNLQSQYTEQKLDAEYLVSLSSDSVPELVNAFLDVSTWKRNDLLGAVLGRESSWKERDLIGTVLACRRYNLKTDRQDESWQSFHFSRHVADRLMQSIDSELDSYQVVDSYRGPYVEYFYDYIWCIQPVN